MGAGLGGCILAESLCSAMDITLVELPESSDYLNQINDLSYPANLIPHVGSGLGGSTKYWHNGLMEIDESIFTQYWPYQKSALSDYYQKAFIRLSKISFKKAQEVFRDLRRQFAALGVPELFLRQGLYYPSNRINVWTSSLLEGRVRLIRAEALGFQVTSNSKIESLEIIAGKEKLSISSDFYVLAAGGLGTPVLLHKLAEKVSLPSLRHAGRNYEDHPTGFVAEVKTNRPFYHLWNFKAFGLNGSFRIPISITQDSLQISFQLRPAYQSKGENPFVSILNDLRNHPLRLKNYVKLFLKFDDLFEILSFKLGFNFPTRNFSVLMVAQQAPQPDLSIKRDNIKGCITRKWILTEGYINSLDQALHKFLQILSPGLIKYRIFSGWQNRLASSAHHSGTARMASDPNTGICNENGQVYGVDNLFICDGSMIPASGFANTGLTIAALGLKLGDYLKNLCEKRRVHQ